MLIGTIIDPNKYSVIKSVMDNCCMTITTGYQWLCMVINGYGWLLMVMDGDANMLWMTIEY